MTDSAHSKQMSLLCSATTLAKTLVSMVHTRLHLLAMDLEEDRLYLLQIIKYGLLAFFCISIGITVLTVFIAVLFWDTHRLLILAVLSAVFMLAGLMFWRYAVVKAREKPSLFTTSLSELLKDWHSLEEDVSTQEYR